MRRKVTMGDLGTIITGNTPPRSMPELYGDYTPFVKATDISESEKYTYTPEECYSKEGHDKYIRSLVPKGSTCVVTIGSIGKKMTMAHCDLFINQAMNAIIPNENFDNEFVYYAVKNVLSNIKGLDSGTASGRENVSKSAFSRMEVVVDDDLIIQQRIATILSRYDSLIENYQKQIKLLEEAAQRLYKEWFVDLRFPGHENTKIVDGVPEGWEKKKVGEVCDINKTNIPKEYKYDYIRYTDLGNVREGTIQESVRYDYGQEPGRAKRIAKDGDTIWGMVRPNLKSFALVQNPQPYDVYSTGFAVLSPVAVPFTFLYCALTTDAFVGYLVNCTNGAAYPAVKAEHFKNAEIIIPHEKLLESFHHISKPIFRKIKSLSAQIRLLSEARDRLLPKLMNGEISAIGEMA